MNKFRLLAGALAVAAPLAIPGVATLGHAATLTLNGCTSLRVSQPDAFGNVSINCVTSTGTGGTVPPPPPPPDPGGGTGGTGTDNWDGICTGYANTRVVTIPWGAPGTSGQQGFTQNNGGFSRDEIVVVKIFTGDKTAAGVLGSISSAEFSGDASHRRSASFSDTPCKFGRELGQYALTESISPNFRFQVGGTSTVYPVLKTNTWYFINVKNETLAGDSTCRIGQSCNMLFTLRKPTGL